MHITEFIEMKDLDQKTIDDCSQQGSCDEAVAYHRKRLGLTVDRQSAIKTLREYGAWTKEELDSMSDEDLAETILWVACGDFSEYQSALEDGYGEESAPYGSDIFILS